MNVNLSRVSTITQDQTRQVVNGAQAPSQFLSIAGIFSLILGISLGLETGLPGNVRYGEILCLILLPVAWRWREQAPLDVRSLYKTVIWVIASYCGWQLFVDSFFHDLPFSSTLKIVGTLVLGLTNFVSISSFLIRNPQTIVAMLLGWSIGELFLAPEPETSYKLLQNEYWDLKVASWGGPLVLAAILYFRKAKIIFPLFLALSYATAAVIYGARSHGTAIALGALLPLVLKVAPVTYRETLTRRPMLLIFAFILVCIPVFIGYVTFAQSGLLTDKVARQTRALDNPYNPLEVIKSGRGGFYYGIQLIEDRPWLGYGSLAYSNSSEDHMRSSSTLR